MLTPYLGNQEKAKTPKSNKIRTYPIKEDEMHK